MEIAQPGDIAHGIFVWLIGGKEHVPALAGVVLLPPEKVAAVVSEQWLTESEAFAIWCYCLLLARRVQGIPEQQLQTLYGALQIPEDFSRFWRQLPACESDTVRGIVENPSMELTGAVNAAVTGWFREHPAHPVVLDGLQSILVEHPWDRRTLAALKAVPGVEKITSAVLDLYVRSQTMGLMASALEVTEQSLPAVHRVYMRTTENLGMKNSPPLYIDQMGDVLNAQTTGADKPIVIASTILVTHFSDDELSDLLYD